MSDRQFAPADYNALKTASKLLIADLGGLDAAASCTRVKRSHLGEYGVPGNESFMPGDVAMDLERVAGTPHYTAALARAAGYVLMPVDTARTNDELSVLFAKMGRDIGELFATAAVALSHGQPTDKERLTLVRELDDLRQITAQAISFLSKKPQS